MRIGYDGTPLIGPRTGIPWYTFHLIESVATASPSDQLLVWPVSWRTSGTVRAPQLPNVRVVKRFAPARALWQLWHRMPFPPLEAFVRCDVFHAVNYLAPPSWRTPVVVTVHDLGFVHRPGWSLPAVRRFASLLPPVLRRASAVICVSRFTAEQLTEWQPSVAAKTRVVHIAPHPRVGAAPRDVPYRYALMIGAFDPRKNLPLALDALRVLRSGGSDLRLVLLGTPSPLTDLQSLLKERSLSAEDVVAPGYADDDAAASWIAGARMLISTSIYEGFNLPILEAMGAGVPVVAAHASCNPEIAGDAALLPEADAEAFAGAMSAVDADDALRHALIGAGRDRAASFSWNRTATQTLAVYRELI